MGQLGVFGDTGDQRGRYYRDKRQSYPPDCERDTAKQYVFRV